MKAQPVFFTLCCLLWAGTAAANVPMFNASCPGGADIHADAGGPVYVNGRETQLQRFNDNYYEARDAVAGITLSISRTADGGVDVSYTGKGGANGICTLATAGASRQEPPQTPAPATHPRGESSSGGGDEVTCESRDQGKTECDMDTSGEVQLVKQLSRARCEQGQSWGLSRHSVWVTDGCRAVFRNMSGHRSHSSGASTGIDPAGATLLGACNVRARAQGALVTKVPVGDSVTEMIVDYPDGRYLCMVRNDGYVQSLTVLRKK